MNPLESSSARTDMKAGRRIKQSEWSAYTRTWWKFVVAGPVIIAAVILGAALGIDAWFVGFAAVILACLLIAAGLVLGVTNLVLRGRPIAHASSPQHR